MVENFKECIIYDKGYGAGYKWIYDLYVKFHYLDGSGSWLKGKLFFKCTVITYSVYISFLWWHDAHVICLCPLRA